jgi:hypothetical protein
MKYIISTVVVLMFSSSCLLLLLVTIPQWKDSLTGVVGKVFSTLYYSTTTMSTMMGLFAMIKENTRLIGYYSTLLGLFVLVSLVQLTISTLMLLNGRDAAITQCFKWVAFNPTRAPRQPDCGNAVTVSVWVAFSIYALGAILYFITYKMIQSLKSKILPPLLVVNVDSFVGNVKQMDIEAKPTLRSPSVCSDSPMLEEPMKRWSIYSSEEKEDTVINSGGDDSDMGDVRRMSLYGEQNGLLVDHRPQSQFLAGNRSVSVQFDRTPRRFSESSLVSDFTLVVGSSSPPSAPLSAVESATIPTIESTPVDVIESQTISVLESTMAPTPIQQDSIPVFQLMAPTLERHRHNATLDRNENPFPFDLQNQIAVDRYGMVVESDRRSKRQSLVPFRVMEERVWDRRPSDSQLYIPTMERRGNGGGGRRGSSSCVTGVETKPSFVIPSRGASSRNGTREGGLERMGVSHHIPSHDDVVREKSLPPTPVVVSKPEVAVVIPSRGASSTNGTRQYLDGVGLTLGGVGVGGVRGERNRRQSSVFGGGGGLTASVVRERRPSDSQLYTPTTIDRRRRQVTDSVEDQYYYYYSDDDNNNMGNNVDGGNGGDVDFQDEIQHLEDKLSEIMSRRGSSVSKMSRVSGRVYGDGDGDAR